MGGGGFAGGDNGVEQSLGLEQGALGPATVNPLSTSSSLCLGGLCSLETKAALPAGAGAGGANRAVSTAGVPAWSLVGPPVSAKFASSRHDLVTYAY